MYLSQIKVIFTYDAKDISVLFRDVIFNCDEQTKQAVLTSLAR